MRERSKQDNGNGKSPVGLGKSVLISRPSVEDKGVNWLGVGIIILLVIALLIFVYGLFYRLAEERVDNETVESSMPQSDNPVDEAIFSYADIDADADVAPAAEEVTPLQETVAIAAVEDVHDRFVVPEPAVLIDKDEYVEGLEDKLRIMASRLSELQNQYDMLQGSLLKAKERNKELLIERESLRTRTATLEQQLEDATLILEEIANY